MLDLQVFFSRLFDAHLKKNTPTITQVETSVLHHLCKPPQWNRRYHQHRLRPGCPRGALSIQLPSITVLISVVTGPVGAEGPDDHAQQPPDSSIHHGPQQMGTRHASGPPTTTLISITQLGEEG